MEKKDLATLAARNVGEKEKPTNARIALEETNALVVGEQVEYPEKKGFEQNWHNLNKIISIQIKTDNDIKIVT